MAKIEDIDIGTVTAIEKIQNKTFIDITPAASLGTYTQNLIAEKHEWRIEGFLTDPSQAIYESLEDIRNHGLICFIDMADLNPLLLGWGKITYLRLIDEEHAAGITLYEMIVRVQPAVGLSYIPTAEAFLSSIRQKSKERIIDPHFGRFGKTYSTDRLTLSYTIRIKNFKASSQDVLLEIQVGDDLSSLTISPSTGWTQATGIRGETIETGIISRLLGCNKRVLLKRSFTAGESVEYTITIVLSSHKITYVEAGLEAGAW